jgi:hypothetical protein
VSQLPYFDYSGRRYDRVTAVLGLFRSREEPETIPGSVERRMTEKAEVSKRLHSLLGQVSKLAAAKDTAGVNEFLDGVAAMEPDLHEYCLKWTTFALENVEKVLVLNQRFYDADTGTTGEPDLVYVSRKGQVVLVDWKMKHDLGFRDVLQTMAYKVMLSKAGFFVDDRVLVQFKHGKMEEPRQFDNDARDEVTWRQSVMLFRSVGMIHEEVKHGKTKTV